METSQIPERPSLAQDWLDAFRYWLRRRRGATALAGLIVIVGVVSSWSWLVAAGIAPLLLGALPCVAMCAIGLCANKMAGRSCSGQPEVAKEPSREPAARLTSTAEGGRAVSPEPDAPALSGHGMVAADAVERRTALKQGD